MLIAVTSPSFSKNSLLRKEVLTYFPYTKFNDGGERLEGERLIEFIGDADGLIVGLERLDREIIERLPNNLKIISKYGVGLDNIDLDSCKKRNIHIGWTPGVNRTSVAEIVVAFMISLSRNIFSTSNLLKKGIWNKEGGFNLSGKIVGIIGVGNIGKEVARLLKPFKVRCLVNDIIDQSVYYKENNLIEVTKDEIYAQADLLTIHVPLTDKTIHLINRDAIVKMKKTAFLINTSRGKVVIQQDLKWALINNIIAGAAIDVYEEEPPEDMEFLSLPNLICTPHIGGNSIESVLAMGRSAIQHLRDFFCT